MHLPALCVYQFTFFCAFFNYCLPYHAMPGQLMQLGCSCSFSDCPEAFFHELASNRSMGNVDIHGQKYMVASLVTLLRARYRSIFITAASFLRTVPESLSCGKIVRMLKKKIHSFTLRLPCQQNGEQAQKAEQAPARQAQRSRRKKKRW